MATKLQALPDQFFKQAIKPLMKQIRLPFFLKRKFSATALQLHQKNTSHKERVQQLAQLLGNRQLEWDEAAAQLKTEQNVVDNQSLLQLFVENSSFNTFRYYRRELLLEQLKADKDSKIRVDVSMATSATVAPCGRRQGEVLDNTRENLKRIPPCGELRCACDWDVFAPEE